MGGRSPSRIASLAGRTVAEAFVRYREQFLEITGRAESRFAEDDLEGLRSDAVQRLDLYRSSVEHSIERIGQQLDHRLKDRSLWPSIKAVYSALICERDDWELAE
ncbi:MAG: isocitrate dehydrogenase kinase/phosphatase AceK regulatory subunit, partial [Myxococcota bacterium]